MNWRGGFAILFFFSMPALAERRAALLVGENVGDQADAPLRYAESDAEAMRDVFVRIGGVAEGDATLLRGVTAPELRGALAALAERLAREGWGKSDRLIIYVSAHSGAGELHLRGSRFALSDFRDFIDASPVGVALLIFDTCEAGAAIRAKGLVPLSGRVVAIEKPTLTGRIVIASAGPEESAFESDEMGGSVFTRHFIAGLRGAADSSRDGRVTLQEAYAYAYARTIESVATSRATPQTPIFDMDLQGAGELVIAELALGRARLTLQIDRPGEWIIASVDTGTQVARFSKGAGPVVFAVDPGTWRLRTRTGDFYAEDTVRLTDGAQAIVTEQDLSRWSLVPAGRKGTGPATTIIAAGAIASGAVSNLGVLGGAAVRVQHALDWASGTGRPVLVASISQVTGHPQNGSFFEREIAFAAGGGLERFVGPFLLSAVGEGGVLAVRQQGLSSGAVFGVQPRFDAQLAAAWRFAGAYSIELAVVGGGLLVRTAEQRHVQPFLIAEGGMGWTW